MGLDLQLDVVDNYLAITFKPQFLQYFIVIYKPTSDAGVT